MGPDTQAVTRSASVKRKFIARILRASIRINSKREQGRLAYEHEKLLFVDNI